MSRACVSHGAGSLPMCRGNPRFRCYSVESAIALAKELRLRFACAKCLFRLSMAEVREYTNHGRGAHATCQCKKPRDCDAALCGGVVRSECLRTSSSTSRLLTTISCTLFAW